MQQTENLKLKLIEGGDPVDWEVMNENAEKLEAETARLDGALTQGLAAVAAALGSSGKNARITWGSYNGTGAYGSGNKTTITPGLYPVLVCVGSPSDVSYSSWPWFMMRPSTVAQAMTGYNINVSWTDTSVSWYGDRDANQQMNQSGKTYYYVALGYDKDAETAG